MSSKPKVAGLTEDEYWRMFHVIRGDIEAAIKSNSAFWRINNLARDERESCAIQWGCSFMRNRALSACSLRPTFSSESLLKLLSRDQQAMTFSARPLS
jgi:hypothetical protein